ncbi:MAG: hypothetical protein KGO81_09355 [Bacteroidota bacterium]|nr:hypothetical protein [Bacteroidota bacterium]
MANVKLSKADLELMMNAEVILTKNRIIEAVYALFGQLAANYQQQAATWHLPEEVEKISPKISRGEHYEALPWVMLDYPRYFSGDDFFSVRTFFWWGNFFSITILLKGKYLLPITDELLQKLNDQWYIGVGQDEWQHHFREDNYLPLQAVPANKLQELAFLKLAKKIPLSEWDSMYDLLQHSFSELARLWQ